MEINYQEDRMQEPIACLLTGVDFDAEIMNLQPIPGKYQHDDFPANIKYCSVPKKITEFKVIK